MSTFRILPTVVALLAALPGCGPSRAPDNTHPSSSALALQTVTDGTRTGQTPLPAVDETIAPGTVLTIPQVLSIAQRHNPTRAVFTANRHAAAAHLLQAQAWDNPEAEVEVGRATTTDGEKLGVGRASIHQRIPWPGKRSARIDAAQAESTVADSEARSMALELAGDVTATALDIAVDQQALDQAQAAQAIAKEVLGVVERRLAAGEASKSDVLRARVDALQADRVSAALASDLTASRASLNALCGGVLPDSFTVTVVLDEFPVTSREQALATAQIKHPEFGRLQATLRQHQLEIERERSAAYPDVTVGVFGGKETDSHALGVSLGIDLPLWNRNQGGIDAASADVERAQADLTVLRAKVLREVDAAWRDYEKARMQVERYAKDLRPVAQDALRLALGSYQAGETALLDLLDARRTAQGIESSLLDAIRQAHAARVRLDLATGSIADTSTGTTP